MKVDEEIFDETKVKVRHKKVTKEDEMKKGLPQKKFFSNLNFNIILI